MNDCKKERLTLLFYALFHRSKTTVHRKNHNVCECCMYFYDMKKAIVLSILIFNLASIQETATARTKVKKAIVSQEILRFSLAEARRDAARYAHTNYTNND